MDEPTHQPARVIVGNCPACGAVVVLFNNFETWGIVQCGCGWAGGTTDIANHHRVERVHE